jgi:hypothetical protein
MRIRAADLAGKYLALGTALGIDDALAIAPQKAPDPDTAYAVMSKGMAQGLFTGPAWSGGTIPRAWSAVIATPRPGRESTGQARAYPQFLA